MHIGLIIDGLAGGGAEKVVLTLADAIVRKGHQVTLVLLRAERAYPVPAGIDIILLEDYYRGPFRRQSEVWRRARALDRELNSRFGSQPFDLTISHLPKTDRIVAASKRLNNVWFCWHGAIASTQLNTRSGLSHWWKQRQLASTYHGKNLIAVSQGLVDDIHLVARPAHIEIIANPIDTALVAQLAKQPCPMAGQPFIVHVGRFHPVKRHDRLLQAFRASEYHGQLVLIGQGSPAEEAGIRQESARLGIQDRVVFAGFQANPYCWLAAAQALVLSSDYEGLPLVLVEALACGTPAISTRYSPAGPSDILRDDLARCIAEPDAASLAHVLTNTLAYPPKIRPEHIEAFTLDVIVERYLALIGRSF